MKGSTYSDLTWNFWYFEKFVTINHDFILTKHFRLLDKTELILARNAF